MKKIQTSSKLLILFVLAILLPSLFLGYFAVSTVEQEEALLEHQWKESLNIDVYHIAALMRKQLLQIERELDFVFIEEKKDLKELAAQWEKKSPYIETVFVLSDERYFLWPHYGNGLTQTQWSFIKNHFDFFKDRQLTPSFDNLAIWKTEGTDSKNIPLTFKSDSLGERTAITFSEIIKNKKSGIIPQLIDNKLHLIYWKKLSKNKIAGCVINQQYMMTKSLEIFPRLHSNSRALNILNERSEPIYGYVQSAPINWKEPFLTVRISESLPFWQVAAYLTDPASIKQSAKTTAFIIWFMISVLIMTILTGGHIIIRTLRDQSQLAQQKVTFAANVSHELRTPLTSIKMFIEMLQQDDLAKNKKSDYLNIIYDETERLNRLINNVLDFSRSNEKNKVYYKATTDINKTVEHILKQQKLPLEKKGFSLDFKLHKGSLKVNCDEESIQQVILNLIDNAVKYSDECKSIVIQTTTKDNIAIIRVEDSGIGIDPLEIDQIFEAYYRADDKLTSRSQGTGLGLTIAQQIIRDHMGKISYTPKKPGSIFTIELPLYKEAA